MVNKQNVVAVCVTALCFTTTTTNAFLAKTSVLAPLRKNHEQNNHKTELNIFITSAYLETLPNPPPDAPIRMEQFEVPAPTTVTASTSTMDAYEQQLRAQTGQNIAIVSPISAAQKTFLLALERNDGLFGSKVDFVIGKVHEFAAASSAASSSSRSVSSPTLASAEPASVRNEEPIRKKKSVAPSSSSSPGIKIDLKTIVSAPSGVASKGYLVASTVEPMQIAAIATPSSTSSTINQERWTSTSTTTTLASSSLPSATTTTATATATPAVSSETASTTKPATLQDSSYPTLTTSSLSSSADAMAAAASLAPADAWTLGSAATLAIAGSAAPATRLLQLKAQEEEEEKKNKYALPPPNSNNNWEDSTKDYDVRIPYDAPAKLAYEASEKSMPYDAFREMYEAEAVEYVTAKRRAERSYDASPPPSSADGYNFQPQTNNEETYKFEPQANNGATSSPGTNVPRGFASTTTPSSPLTNFPRGFASTTTPLESSAYGQTQQPRNASNNCNKYLSLREIAEFLGEDYDYFYNKLTQLPYGSILFTISTTTAPGATELQKELEAKLNEPKFIYNEKSRKYSIMNSFIDSIQRYPEGSSSPQLNWNPVL